MAIKRRNPTVARVGNYAQEVDSTGLGDEAMEAQLFGTKPDKVEKDYMKGARNKTTAREAVRRARKANKKPPLSPDNPYGFGS